MLNTDYLQLQGQNWQTCQAISGQDTIIVMQTWFSKIIVFVWNNRLNGKKPHPHTEWWVYHFIAFVDLFWKCIYQQPGDLLAEGKINVCFFIFGHNLEHNLFLNSIKSPWKCFLNNNTHFETKSLILIAQYLLEHQHFVLLSFRDEVNSSTKYVHSFLYRKWVRR